MVVTSINQLRVADITYIRLARKFIYLAVVMDAFSRRIVGWALERFLNAELTMAALRMALAGRAVQPGLVHHSAIGYVPPVEFEQSLLAVNHPYFFCLIQGFTTEVCRDSVRDRCLSKSRL